MVISDFPKIRARCAATTLGGVSWDCRAGQAQNADVVEGDEIADVDLAGVAEGIRSRVEIDLIHPENFGKR